MDNKAFLKSLRWDEFETWALTAYDILNGDLGALYDNAVEAFPEIHAVGGFDYHYAPSVCRAGGRQLVDALRESILRDKDTDYKDYIQRVRANRLAD